MTIRVTLDQRVLNDSLRGTNGMVAKHLLRLATRVEARAKRNAPVDTGRLRSSITKRVGSKGGELVAEVRANTKYALFVHEGTGIYGPRRRRITPRAGAFLVFTPRGASKSIFARSVAGTRPNPFITKALRAVIKG